MNQETGASLPWVRATVKEVVRETADACSFVIEPPASSSASFSYRPGQFLTLRLPVAGRYLPRCYSMSSAPSLDALPRVTIKRVSGGRGSNWACDHLRPGSEIEVLPPAGVFSPKVWNSDFLLLAGGSGITPIHSILRTALTTGVGQIHLVYANRDERSVIFAGELREWAHRYPQRLQITHWLDSIQGVPSVEQLMTLAQGCAGAQVFICGPGPFMDASVQALQSLGWDETLIHVERFVSLPEEDAPVPEPVTSASVDALIEVLHQGQAHPIACKAGESILEAALRAGIELPNSCRSGFCGSCMCRVESGQVHLKVNQALDERDLAKGWTLACQAVPLTERVTVKFAE